MIDEAHDVAAEHLRWAGEAGLTARDVLEAIGVTWPNANVTPQTVLMALRFAWRDLQPTALAAQQQIDLQRRIAFERERLNRERIT